MKRLFLTLTLAIASSACVLADDFNYLNVTSTSSARSFALNQVRRITFSGSDMVVTTTEGTSESIALATLNSLAFSATAPTAIRNLSTESCKSLQLEADRVVVNGKGILKLYNANGQLVRQMVVDGGNAELSLYGLPRGIYIARIGTQSLKLAH